MLKVTLPSTTLPKMTKVPGVALSLKTKSFTLPASSVVRATIALAPLNASAPDPGHIIKLHTDDNNVQAKEKEDYRLRIITALNDDEDFTYTYEFEGIRHNIKLSKGQSIIFDPDKVKHGLINNSKSKARYALVQIFKTYPVHRGLIDFINTDQLKEI